MEDLTYFGQHQFFWFAEGGVNGDYFDLTRGALWSKCPNYTTPGVYMKFRVTHFPIGTTDWSMDVDCKDGAGWRNLKVYDNTGWYTGYSLVETGRFGGNDTGMSDDHVGIQRKTSGNVWTNWSNMACLDDNVASWNGQEVSATHYRTTVNSVQSCPRP
ncbi:MAG: hypothetical protein WD770_07100 [Actinomycetota bacterium]